MEVLELDLNNGVFDCGDRVVVKDDYLYLGLKGEIVDIVLYESQSHETENEGDDIYIAVDPLTDPIMIEEFEKKASVCYGEKKTIENIAYDLLILSPSQLSLE